MPHEVRIELGGRTLRLETGRIARQATGSCLVQYADTVVLSNVVSAKRDGNDRGFLPLFVDYREKAYAAGRIPGGFFKREGRPGLNETVSARLIDRALRPFFDKDIRFEITVANEVLSSDQENRADILALISASTAVCLSDIPFPGPVGAVRIGKVGGELVLNPTHTQLEESTMDLVVAGTKDNIIMVEGDALEISEEEFLKALECSIPAIQQIVSLQEELLSQIQVEKRQIAARALPDGLAAAVEERVGDRIRSALELRDKLERYRTKTQLKEEVLEALAETYPEAEAAISRCIEEIEGAHVRRLVLEEERRVDGRALDEIRPISCEVGVLPRTHGSALFTRGQTQALVVTTLGTTMDEQRIEELQGQSWKTFMLHYNFPGYSVGEAKPNRGPGRRDMGHGLLGERALTPIVPSNDGFPYTIRVVSDILESNGSSSMASVCGGSLSLMDAGVPIKSPVAGIATGLISDGSTHRFLTDIQGLEDHLGDMDLKVAGTREGITAIQMDLKIKGLGAEVLAEGLAVARKARLQILDEMDKALSESRSSISPYAPRVTVLQINPERIRDIIGPGGKIIKKITEETGATIDIDDSGKVKVACVDGEMAVRAVDIIKALTEDPEVGQVYNGKVVRITNFGAFVEILPGKDGLIHISELDDHRVGRVEDVVSEGDMVLVKVIGVDSEGKIRLSRRQAMAEHS
ncbi:MAG: polyribonucleotide nucleotidyltransferase [Candidatus Eisenbacteria sp.]|nr:polyribonucleotide nucleotidyltransferase [Candidatus Eisenbacteria bacterium]